VVLPALAEKDADGVRAYLRTAQLALTYVLLVCLAWLFGAADLVVWVLLGSGWDGAALYLRILAVGGVFQVLGYAYYWAFLAAGRMGVLLACEAAGRIVLVGLIVLAVGHGPELVAVAYAVGLLVIWLITSSFGLSRIGLRASELARVGIRPALLAVVVAGALGGTLRLASLLDVPVGAQLLLALAVPACVIACAAAAVAPVRDDIAELRLLAGGAEGSREGVER
jgi:PST family polysaccharide transporter